MAKSNNLAQKSWVASGLNGLTHCRNCANVRSQVAHYSWVYSRMGGTHVRAKTPENGTDAFLGMPPLPVLAPRFNRAIRTGPPPPPPHSSFFPLLVWGGFKSYFRILGCQRSKNGAVTEMLLLLFVHNWVPV